MDSLEEGEIFDFLLELRDSGITNMFGATPYIVDEFQLSDYEARVVLARWMRSFITDD